MTDLKPQTPTDSPEAESPLGPPAVAADGGERDADEPADGGVELTYDQRADAAAEAVRQVALHLRLMEE